MPDWQLLNARLTIFLAPDALVPPTLWRDLIGEEPENSVVQRATATRTERGPFADGNLSLQIQPMRIDWVHEPVGVGAVGGLPPVLGVFPTAADALLQLGRRWVTNGWFPPSTPRVALGFILISPAPDRESGYRELGQFIDGVPNTPDATDFQYQVNRPRASRTGIDGLQVNRLSKWSVGAYGVFVISSAAVAASPSTTTQLLHHLRLELDINTSADFQRPIPRESVESVIDDLLSGASEICEHGNHL
jgi:hypothetical protein